MQDTRWQDNSLHDSKKFRGIPQHFLGTPMFSLPKSRPMFFVVRYRNSSYRDLLRKQPLWVMSEVYEFQHPLTFSATHCRLFWLQSRTFKAETTGDL
jgi:hypothetical protein